MGFPGSSVVKNQSAMPETRVQSLGQEEPLEKEMATRSSILTLGNCMDRGGLWWAAVYVVTEVGHDLATKQQRKIFTHCWIYLCIFCSALFDLQVIHVLGTFRIVKL